MVDTISPFDAAAAYILEDDEYKFRQALERCDVLTLDPQENLIKLHELLVVCAAYYRATFVPLIFVKWFDEDPNSITGGRSMESTLLRCFSSGIFADVDDENDPDYVLPYLITLYPDSAVDMIVEIITKADNSEEKGRIANRIASSYNLDYQTTKDMYNEAMSNDLYQIGAALQQYLVIKSPVARIPDWIIPRAWPDTPRMLRLRVAAAAIDRLGLPFDEPILHRVDEIEISIPKFALVQLLSTSEATELMMATFAQMNDVEGDFETLRQTFVETYERADRTGRLELIGPYLEADNRAELQSNIGLTLLFGPANPFYGEPQDGLTDCSSYGGCRMLICNCRRNVDELFDPSGEDRQESIDTIQWFVGYCQSCSNRIQRSCLAVRLPFIGGGWQGCYCSFSCARQAANNLNREELLMIDIVEARINTTKIGDRSDQPAPEDEPQDYADSDEEE